MCCYLFYYFNICKKEKYNEIADINEIKEIELPLCDTTGVFKSLLICSREVIIHVEYNLTLIEMSVKLFDFSIISDSYLLEYDVIEEINRKYINCPILIKWMDLCSNNRSVNNRLCKVILCQGENKIDMSEMLYALSNKK
jgi:hypothetical protein